MAVGDGITPAPLRYKPSLLNNELICKRKEAAASPLSLYLDGIRKIKSDALRNLRFV
jgi:hypothetical protein